MTFLTLPTPGYISASGTCTTDGLAHVVALAPNRTGYWWAGYQAAIPGSGGGQLVIRLDLDGVGTLYTGTADESGSETMYINHMGIHYMYNGVLGPGNVLRAYGAKAGRSNFDIGLFYVFIPSQGYTQ
jgi:hypothetical protein